MLADRSARKVDRQKTIERSLGGFSVHWHANCIVRRKIDRFMKRLMDDEQREFKPKGDSPRRCDS
ncbi:hypothetical protein M514_06767 [Trichuris suis]|uniref:Uncharacterized protein n=1 Tax=Trichuris suis TaxID=68888 RepID=A0A085NKG9_9BILA|nr:hypothetical protein M513_06767 [Trichuris suis]KFD69965.1 hypothetical protein M514_06767 [Trichuris suis]